MTPQQLEVRRERAVSEALVISRTEDGFRVYSPTNPVKSYLVAGGPEAPTCTCPDFEVHASDPDWRCKHILAVLRKSDREAEPAERPDRHEIEERRAIQEEGRPREAAQPERPANGPTQMLLKRSVSPDGRIDSLSVEFACPVEQATVREIKSRAVKALRLQAEIVEGFLDANGKEPQRRKSAGNANDRAVAADMIDIGGMNTRWGRRLFINVKANGKALKLFGTEKQLSEAIAAAGYPDRTEFIEEGVNLMLPCRVITKPSEDGKYLNIERVLPAGTSRPQRRARA